jgi:Ca2+-binding EF-hand superfamily protein
VLPRPPTDEIQTPLPAFELLDKALAVAADDAARAIAAYKDMSRQLAELQQQLPDPSEKGGAKADPAIVEEIANLEPLVEEQKRAAKSANRHHQAAQAALTRSRMGSFVKIQSERNVRQTQSLAQSYFEEKGKAEHSIDLSLKALIEQRRVRKEQRERDRQENERLGRAQRSGGIVNHPVDWCRVWPAHRNFGAPPKTPKPKWMPPAPPPETEPPEITELKRRLAQNLTRVTDLFKQWDVDHDHTISITELRLALGALRIPHDERSLAALFVELDADQSGSIDFEELYRALRQDAPKRAPPDQITLEVPNRREPPMDGTAAERRAVAFLKKALHNNLGRISDLFNAWDADGNGVISKYELRRALAAQCIPVDKGALDALFRKLDTDESGGIEFRELNRMLRREFTFDHDTIEATLVTKAVAAGIPIPPPSPAPRAMSTSFSAPVLRPHTVSFPGARSNASRGMRRVGSTAPGLHGRQPRREESARAAYNRKLRRHDHAVVRDTFFERETSQRETEMERTRSSGALLAPPGGGSSVSLSGAPTTPQLGKRA